MSRTRGLREKVAPGIRRKHREDCGKSHGKSRCTCAPMYEVRVGGRDGMRTKTLATLAEAVEWRDNGGRDRAGNSPDRSPTFIIACESFLDRARRGVVTTRSGRPYSTATLDAYEVHLRNWATALHDPTTGEAFADEPVGEMVEGRALQRMAGAMTGEASASTIRATMAAVRAVLLTMYDDGHIATMPPTVRLPAPPERRTRTYTDEEVGALILAADRDDERLGRRLMGPLLRLLASSGLRISEALALRWSDRGITIEDGTARIVVESGKTANAAREVIVMDPAAVASLAAMDRQPGALVFAGPDGSALEPRGLPRAALTRIARAAEVKGAGWHAFRRTHATNLGTDPEVDAATLAARLGHSDPSFTARVYVTGRDDRARALAERAAASHGLRR